MRLRALLIAVLAALILATLRAPAAQACSCVASTPEESAARADVIFLGTVAGASLVNRGARTSSADPIQVTFDVRTAWKGDPPAELTLETARDSASCGYNFEVGASYLVYASQVDGVLTTDLCSGTKSEFEAGADLNYLGGGRVMGGSGAFPLWIGIVLAAGVVVLLLAAAALALQRRLEARAAAPPPWR